MLEDKLSEYEIMALGGYEKVKAAGKRAVRLSYRDIPDGAKKYQPVTEKYYARQFLGPHSLRKIIKATRKER